jgi:hypothetical protein
MIMWLRDGTRTAHLASMQSIAYETLEDVTGAAGNWTTKVDSAVSKVYPGWNNMSCTSRGMWMGTAAGSVTGAAGWALSPVTGGVSPAVGSTLAPIAGTLASTSYIEGCQNAQKGK